MIEDSELFWSTVPSGTATNEASVETLFVLPLLEALGHDRRHIASKVPVVFKEGRRGRRPEADYVVYAETEFSRATSLIVVEAKHPREQLVEGKEQGESYAQNLRAPILLLTNGDDLEVWQLQLTAESACVLRCKVADLAQHRDALEGLLSPEALREHCKGMTYKNFDLHRRDLCQYERAVHDHAAKIAGHSIPRQLENKLAAQTSSSNTLLDVQERGAVVTGASGSGKTVLGGMLLAEAIERRRAGQAMALPIHLFAPDLVQSGESLERFLTARVTAHKPGFTEARLREIARENGLVVIVDGFERATKDERRELVANLRVLLQDHPRTRAYVLSRAGCAPTDLPLSTLALQPYGPEELRALASHRNVPNAFVAAPSYVARLAETPLLADLILDRFTRERTFPTELSPLFDDWIRQVLSGSDPLEMAFDQDLLEAIAVATQNGPLDAARLREIAAVNSYPEAALRRLVERDVLSVQGTAFELRHEALADHLRTLRFWRSHPDANEAALSVLPFDTTSLFPALLVSNAPNTRARGVAWEAIAGKNLKAAIRALRFSGYDQSYGGSVTEEKTLSIAKMLGGAVETVINAHLEPIAPLLRERIAGFPANCLGVNANINDDFISYHFVDADGAAATAGVAFQRDDDLRRIYGRALSQLGFGLGAGQVLGMQHIQSALEEVAKDRDLPGGRVWREERAFGRLRFLNLHHGAQLDPLRFDLALAHLVSHAGEWVCGPQSSGGFAINSLLSDLRWLNDQGVDRIEQWWVDLERLDLRSSTDQDHATQALNSYYLRRQLAYDEVVSKAFPALRCHLETLRSMPVRMQLSVELHDPGGFSDVTLHRKSWPVRTFDDAGAEVRFGAKPADFFDQNFSNDYYRSTGELLREYGRYHNDYTCSWSSGGLPNLVGLDRYSYGQTDDSPVVSGAMSWLKSDLKKLFSEMPSGTWQGYGSTAPKSQHPPAPGQL
ncbi:NACHT domain-containing protein [Phaeobacter inhibens]|uniref:NACHT domain-containing protein n=1 Tax=Phaeobacter inhibens TaxID=221822 RepID=UPI0021A58FB7|nr:type I restriction enzyme HsdR N-terminal domain-containing protein [Phaeobacter inhibens]UWR51065.1 type I restriction enzyme HsdR N-terminal domain-containing protein [Phaeobacter inhibens]UWR62629.1 type I restriction enzyme HsdR N-terminal domain-containing protein [Phaeobacter inhibens]